MRTTTFLEGDFVFRARLLRKRRRKTALCRRGPYRFTACRSEYILQVEYLMSGDRFESRDRRQRFFRNKDVGTTEKMLSNQAYQENKLFLLERMKDI